MQIFFDPNRCFFQWICDHVAILKKVRSQHRRAIRFQQVLQYCADFELGIWFGSIWYLRFGYFVMYVGILKNREIKYFG